VKSKEDNKKGIGPQPVAMAEKRRADPSKLGSVSLDHLSGDALIRALRGSCKGKGSLVAALQRERRRDDRRSEQKRNVIFGKP
jgi:hypothetical protein